jgi:hypothetical protein
VTPLNPESGGTSVDGNWELATPYPSAGYTEEAPDVCSLTTFGPAWVDTPSSYWLPDSDGLSQWISPYVNFPGTTGGWYIYRTTVPIPSNSSGEQYLLTVAGRLLADDLPSAVVFQTSSLSPRTCSVVSLPSLAPVTGSPTAIDETWDHFHFATIVAPGTSAYLYVIVFNVEYAPGVYGNGTGLRVEFTSVYFTPI